MVYIQEISSEPYRTQSTSSPQNFNRPTSSNRSNTPNRPKSSNNNQSRPNSAQKFSSYQPAGQYYPTRTNPPNYPAEYSNDANFGHNIQNTYNNPYNTQNLHNDVYSPGYGGQSYQNEYYTPQYGRNGKIDVNKVKSAVLQATNEALKGAENALRQTASMLKNLQQSTAPRNPNYTIVNGMGSNVRVFVNGALVYEGPPLTHYDIYTQNGSMTRSNIVGIDELNDIFEVFLAVNFAGYTQSENEYAESIKTAESDVNELLKEAEVDFVRLHPCVKRADLLIRLKRALYEKPELYELPEDAMMVFKFLHIYQLCLETVCPTIQKASLQLNITIASRYCSEHLKELNLEKNEFIDLFQRAVGQQGGEDESDVAKDVESVNISLNTLTMSRRSFFEWLLINYQIASHALLYGVASRFLELASKFVGFEFDFDGKLGKRTRYQQQSLPQLVLKTTKVDTAKTVIPEVKSVAHPKNIDNKDDTLLQNVKFDENVNVEHLTPDQIGVLLAAALLEQKTDPIQELKFEQMDALCTKILSQPIGFMTSISLFELRSEAERRNTRRVERAVQQMESIMDELENRKDQILDPQEMRDRICDIWISSPLRPAWGVKKFYAKVLMSLALTSEAITVYESIFDWKNVVEGYQAMNMKEKALKVLETLRKQHPDDPYYLCLIGETRRDEDLLNKVLELTNDKYPNAHKALGMMALEKNDYKKGFKHYKRVYQLVPLSVRSVYNYGVCAWELGEIKDAITAFHHVTCIDPDHFKAWNNLAAAYLASNQKSKAAKILKQGLQIDRDNFKMWVNLYEIGAELPTKKDCFFAVQQMMSFKKAASEFDVKPLLKVILSHTNAAENTYYPAPELKDPLDQGELKQLVLTLEAAHEHCTLDPMTLRLMANLKKPKEDEQELEKLQGYIELLDLAEKREMQAGKQNPDYLNTINSLISSYPARIRLSEILGKNPAAAKKMIFFRLRPLVSAVQRLFKEKPSSQEESPKLATVFETAKELLTNLN
ncbi:unnamed protein product [Bursaphelenchus okinawaensis]|uniref:TPR_REGION domain-containing protein n=1 Tax=Bursaphelenchus okinawaensis TaxID=465554 RepID=A0A811K1T6_9BILA|nr:unnamed protein product [Bursaphelenchus okinawaensis]CAG9090018.1 unnamed protein product [Bursaphelenchus okinawaensis]